VQSEAPVIISTDQAGIVQIAGGATFASTRVGPYSATNYRIDATVNSADRLADFTLMKSLGFSTVRLSVDETSLPVDSASTVVPELWVDVLNDVSRAGLTAIAVVSLAPPSTPDDWPREYVVATRVITAIADHDALVMWDLAHEPDRDLSKNQVSQAIGFIYELREFIDSRNSGTPVTVTWHSIQLAADPTLTAMVDVVSLHLNDAEDPASALRELNSGTHDVALVIDTANSKPGWSPAFASETRQAAVASSRLLDLESVGVVRWTMGQFRDEPGDSRGLVDSAGNVREVGALFAAGSDVVLDAPPFWLDAIRSPFWLSTLALLAVTVGCVVVLGLGRARRTAPNQMARSRR
jgi:hypothetical protein